MKKFFAIVKREYKKVVLTWSFLIGTFAAPFATVIFALVPMLMFSIQGEPQRIAIVGKSAGLAERIEANLSADRIAEKARNASTEAIKNVEVMQDENMRASAAQIGAQFVFENVEPTGRTTEELRRVLNERIKNEDLDAYLIVPENLESPDVRFEYFSRNAGDFITTGLLEDAINDAVRAERLARSNIDERRLKEINAKVSFAAMKVSKEGEEKDSGSSFGVAFVIGLLIYITLAIYGQAIMGAVVEEKETRIAEILFSSAKPFQLMMGKLVGVGLAGLTQLSIWLTSALALVAFGAATLASAGVSLAMPPITAASILWYLVFFLLGFFVFSTIFALIGSMVTTVQEGSQFAFLPVMILLAAFYCVFPVSRDPNSAFAFWASIAPFVSPIVMPIRVALETPPLWQILLSATANLLTISFLVWIASKVYRTGMLMYGKRATIPEVWRWIRQS